MYGMAPLARFGKRPPIVQRDLRPVELISKITLENERIMIRQTDHDLLHLRAD
jgi:hypothetical protein